MTNNLSQSQAAMRSIIQRIATGPELSKDISLEEARIGMRAVLEKQVDPIQMGIFLIALRMKRETDEENRGVLSGIRDLTTTVTADVDTVLDIADPYDGYNRSLPASPFLPAVMAACGVATVSHGLETVGPKFGATHKQILRAAGINVDLDVSSAAQRLSDATLGWTYVDQSQFCPTLHDMIDFRTLMVKRSAITTVEVLTGPIRGKQTTHLVTGYVHKPYPPIYASLARHSGYTSALLVRGIEGGVIPSLRQTGKFFYYLDATAEGLLEMDVDPVNDLNIHQEFRAAPIPESLLPDEEQDDTDKGIDTAALAQATAEAGMATLRGQAGATRDSLVYAGAMCLHHLGKVDNIQAGATQVQTVLDNGAALARFK